MKVSQIKQKVAAKVAKGKAKVAKKCGKCAAVKTAVALFSVFALFANSGCTTPAQRAQTASCEIIIHGGTVNFGNEFQSLAQSNETGGNDAGQVTTQTTDTKPEIAVGVGGSSAGVGQSAGTTQSGKFAKIGAAADAVASLVAPGIGGDVYTDAKNAGIEAKPAEATVTPDAAGECADGKCADGNCTNGECTTGGCADGECSIKQ